MYNSLFLSHYCNPIHTPMAETHAGLKFLLARAAWWQISSFLNILPARQARFCTNSQHMCLSYTFQRRHHLNAPLSPEGSSFTSTPVHVLRLCFLNEHVKGNWLHRQWAGESGRGIRLPLNWSSSLTGTRQAELEDAITPGYPALTPRTANAGLHSLYKAKARWEMQIRVPITWFRVN